MPRTLSTGGPRPDHRALLPASIGTMNGRVDGSALIRRCLAPGDPLPEPPTTLRIKLHLPADSITDSGASRTPILSKAITRSELDAREDSASEVTRKGWSKRQAAN